jgi:cytochrome c oxidase subunit IV
MDAETQTPYDDSPTCTATIEIHMQWTIMDLVDAVIHHLPWICLLLTFTLVPQIIQFSIENRVEFKNTVNFVINN